MDDDQVDGLVANLAIWADEQRAHEAAASRVRERWLRVQLEDQATFASLALALAERQSTVLLTTTAGCQHRGRLIALGSDFLLTRAGRRATFIPHRAVATLRAGPGSPAVWPSEERASPLTTTFVQAVTGLAGDRPRVSVVLSRPEDRLAGELTSVGLDVAMMALPAGEGGPTYVRLSSVTELSVLGSG